MNENTIRPTYLNNIKGNWTQERTLGSGGFGTVVLWKNQETGEYLALKRCRNPESMSDRQKRRWEMEVNIMKKLDHVNVIKSVDVPADLGTVVDMMPPMAMEFCEGGDLRKMLIKPENCCGLPEFQVRCIVRDIASAIEYLQGLSKAIIHRDLKPENVVIQETEERTIYKIIDLGYAKEINSDSLCTSFVGTLQYLAPELFSSSKYTMSVDFWSFGLVVFECITGFRPFLHNVTPILCHKHVTLKKPDDIWISQGPIKDVPIYSSHLPPLNHLCRTLRVYFEQWLRMMLRFDPLKRGGGLTADGRQKCFAFLENILKTRMVHIVNVTTNNVLTYPVSDTATLSKVQKLIEEEVKLPVRDQDLVLATGETPDSSQRVTTYMKDDEFEEEEWLIFMFSKSDTLAYAKNDLKPLSQFLKNIIIKPNTLLDYQQQRKAWSEVVFFCEGALKDVRRIFLSERACRLCLLRQNSTVAKAKVEMIRSWDQLGVTANFFFSSLQCDREYCSQNKLPENISLPMLMEWKTMEDEIKNFLTKHAMVSTIDAQMNAIDTKIAHLNQSENEQTSSEKYIDDLQNLKEKAVTLYGELKQKTREERVSINDHHVARQMVVKAAALRENILNDIYNRLNGIIECRQSLRKLQPDVHQLTSQIKSHIIQIEAHQRDRQKCIWDVITSKVVSMDIDDSGLQFLPSDDAVSISSIRQSIDANNVDSLIDTTNRSKQKLEDLLISIDSVSPQSLKDDWEFLKNSRIT